MSLSCTFSFVTHILLVIALLIITVSNWWLLLLIAVTDCLLMLLIIINTIHDEVDAPIVSEILLLVWKNEKNDIQTKTTSLTVVCNRHSSNPEDYFLSMLKKWYSRNIPLHLKVNSLPHCVALTKFITLGHEITIVVDIK